MISVNSNLAALSIMSSINDSDRDLQKAMKRLSTGLRVNSAKDDASGVGVAMRLDASIARRGVIYNEVSNAGSFLETQDSILKGVGDILTKMSEITQKGINLDETKATDLAQLTAYSAEYVKLKAEIASLATESFNGFSLFKAGAGSKTIYTSENDTTQTKTITLPDLAAINTAITPATMLTNANAVTAYGLITTAIGSLSTLRAQNGAEATSFQRSADILKIGMNNLEAMQSRIMDADAAEESANKTKYDILQQSGLAMLMQSNQSRMNVLKLLY
jgi:flagellin